MCATIPLSLHLLLHANSNPPSLPPLPKTRHLPNLSINSPKPFTSNTSPVSQQPSSINTRHLPFIKPFQKPLTFAKHLRKNLTLFSTLHLRTHTITKTNSTEFTSSKSQASNSPLQNP